MQKIEVELYPGFVELAAYLRNLVESGYRIVSVATRDIERYDQYRLEALVIYEQVGGTAW